MGIKRWKGKGGDARMEDPVARRWMMEEVL
jgi:hypothetical protein